MTQILIALGGMIALILGAFLLLVGTMWAIMALFRVVPLVGRRHRAAPAAAPTAPDR